MRELVTLLGQLAFKPQSQNELLHSLSELDEDADGYIKTADLVSFMKTLAEPLNEDEMLQFTTMCSEHDDPDKYGMISIKKLAEVMIPDMVVENEMTRGTKQKDEAPDIEEEKVEGE